MGNAIEVTRLPKDPGPAAWNRILPETPVRPSLEQDISAEWVVIGAGFAGLSAARRLSQLVNGERVVLLEAGRIAEGPAGRNSGFMIDLPHELNSESYAGAHEQDLQQIRLNRSALSFAEEIAREFGFAPQVFNRVGKTTAAASDKGIAHVDSYAAHLQALGEPFELRSAAELKAWTGTDFYVKGIYTPGAAMIQPAAYVRGLAEGISDQVEIYEQSPVTSISTGANKVIQTPRGKVTTRNVILAVNGHLQSFGFMSRRLLHVFTYCSMTRALSARELSQLGGVSDWGILPADPMGTTVRRISDFNGGGDRLVIRNHATLNQTLEAGDGNMKRAAMLQDRSFRNRFPALGMIDMEYRWGGRLCLTLNSVPASGELEEGIWSACCQNGLGTVRGTLAGMVAAEQASGHKSPLVEDFMRHAQPRKLPPEPFLSLGANTTMRWKEWQAGIEL